MRTGGRKTAPGPQYGRNYQLVNFYQRDKRKTKYSQQRFHGQWLSTFVQ